MNFFAPSIGETIALGEGPLMRPFRATFSPLGEEAGNGACDLVSPRGESGEKVAVAKRRPDEGAFQHGNRSDLRFGIARDRLLPLEPS